MAIKSYKDEGTRDIAQGQGTKEARKSLPVTLHQIARKRLAFLTAVESLADLKARSGLGLHALGGERRGQFSIKINDQFRICFRWVNNNAEFVEIVDYH